VDGAQILLARRLLTNRVPAVKAKETHGHKVRMAKSSKVG
jgi:hypothetical protein